MATPTPLFYVGLTMTFSHVLATSLILVWLQGNGENRNIKRKPQAHIKEKSGRIDVDLITRCYTFPFPFPAPPVLQAQTASSSASFAPDHAHSAEIRCLSVPSRDSHLAYEPFSRVQQKSLLAYFPPEREPDLVNSVGIKNHSLVWSPRVYYYIYLPSSAFRSSYAHTTFVAASSSLPTPILQDS